MTIVGAVYETVITNNVAFQRKIEEKQQQEKRIEQAVRTREMLTPKTGPEDTVSTKSAKAADAPVSEPKAAAPADKNPTPVPSPATASNSPLGQTLNTVA